VTQLKIPVDIIVAEDDDDDFGFIESGFRAAHCANAIVRAKDGEELLALLQERVNMTGKGTPHSLVVILDLNMPRKDGREALREIKMSKALRKIPVVVLTTSKADEDIVRSYDLGANWFIRKPASFEGFMGIMEQLKKFWFELVEIPPFA
jgi:CheY-like chemotaxis protein